VKAICEHCGEKFVITNKFKYKPSCPHCRVELDYHKTITAAQVEVLRELLKSGVTGAIGGV
jgi:Zn finger protein HypA/HybF involved in hydrogenase expression